jgi:phosphopantetheinyl transferase
MSSRNERAEILKDEFGKPYIADSDHFISFSHSHGMSAAITSTKVVGIDIQYIVPKITRIAPRFVAKHENDQIEQHHSSFHLDLYHIIWGAKESLYKAYGKRSLDFKTDMSLTGLTWSETHFCQFRGTINKGDYRASFKLEAKKLNNHILVYAELD